MYSKDPKPWSSYYTEPAWRELRLQVYRRDGGRCVECGVALSIKGGKHGGGFVADHIEDHRGDRRLFLDPSNIRCICKPCHDRKSATVNQDRSQRRGESHPAWMPKPACPVVLVTGSPGSGKTTYARQHAGPLDTVIDLDECFRIVTGRHGHEADQRFLSAALWERNRQLADLSRKQQGKAFFIVSAPTTMERNWWLGLLGGEANVQHIHIDTPISVMQQRGVPPKRIDLARAYAARAQQPWSPPAKGQGPASVTASSTSSTKPMRGTVTGIDGFPEGSGW